MKNSFSFFIILSIVFLWGCQNKLVPKVIEVPISQESPKKIEALGEKAYAKLSIEGMTCAIGCAVTIEKKLQRTSGIVSAKVDFESNTGWVTYDATMLNLDGISSVVKSTGTSYSVSKIISLESTIH
jgi:mercuric ion binding protein|tara:strand:- start:1271 stop:1651 length:381 start_codon:yes stop_codon:yes gene_type:complete